MDDDSDDLSRRVYAAGVFVLRRRELRKRPSRLGDDDGVAIDEPTAMIDLSKSAANDRRRSFARRLTIVARAYIVLIVAGLFAYAEARALNLWRALLAFPRTLLYTADGSRFFPLFDVVFRLQPRKKLRSISGEFLETER
jgi:hypothetical protein